MPELSPLTAAAAASAATVAIATIGLVGFLAGRGSGDTEATSAEAAQVAMPETTMAPTTTTSPSTTTTTQVETTVTTVPTTTTSSTAPPTTTPPLIVGPRTEILAGGAAPSRGGAIDGVAVLRAGEEAWYTGPQFDEVIYGDEPVRDAAFSGDLVAVIDGDGVVTAGPPSGSFLEVSGPSGGWRIALLDDATVVVADRSGSLTAYYPTGDRSAYSDGKQLLQLGSGDLIQAVDAFGDWVAYSTENAVLGVVNTRTLAAVTLLPENAACASSSLAVSSTGNLAVVRDDGSTESWDLERREQVASNGGPGVPGCQFDGAPLLYSAAWSQNGALLAIGGSDGRIRFLAFGPNGLVSAGEPLSIGSISPVVELGISDTGILSALDETGALVRWELRGSLLE